MLVFKIKFIVDLKKLHNLEYKYYIPLSIYTINKLISYNINLLIIKILFLQILTYFY